MCQAAQPWRRPELEPPPAGRGGADELKGDVPHGARRRAASGCGASKQIEEAQIVDSKHKSLIGSTNHRLSSNRSTNRERALVAARPHGSSHAAEGSSLASPGRAGAKQVISSWHDSVGNGVSRKPALARRAIWDGAVPNGPQFSLSQPGFDSKVLHKIILPYMHVLCVT